MQNKVDFKDIICIHFISGDGFINHCIKCLKSDTFSQVEEKLYQIYNEYRGRNLIFLHGGKIIIKTKTISELNIKDMDKVQIHDSDI